MIVKRILIVPPDPFVSRVKYGSIYIPTYALPRMLAIFVL